MVTRIGVASATIHVAQQVGGSIGTAMLNTLATALQMNAAVHSYVIVFGVSAAALLLAAIVVTMLLHPIPRRVARRSPMSRRPAVRPTSRTAAATAGPRRAP